MECKRFLRLPKKSACQPVRDKGISKMAENLRDYGLTEAQITELVRKSRETAGAKVKTIN